MLDGFLMWVTSVVAVSGLAHVGSRNDTRGFKAILAATFGGTLLSMVMKRRATLEVLALVVPGLSARFGVEYTDQLTATELRRAEHLPASKSALLAKKENLKANREDLHVHARGGASRDSTLSFKGPLGLLGSYLDSCAEKEKESRRAAEEELALLKDIEAGGVDT